MANNNLNKKIIKLKKQTDETMAKLASQTDKLEGNNMLDPKVKPKRIKRQDRKSSKN